MTKPYENSRLWQEAFAKSSDTNARKLAAEYDAAWDKACSIASRIQSDALGLTLHDDRHFLALWKAADLLVPTDLKLTPVEVFIFDCDSEVRRAIKGDWTSSDGEAWLRRINAIEALPKVVSDHVGLMTLVEEAGSPTGRASLNPTKRELGIYTVGGLALKRREGVGSPQNFFGSLDRKPSGPKREPRGSVDKGRFSVWATEQVKIWAQAKISQQERNFIAANAAYLGGDPFILANARIDGDWHSLEDIYNRILRCEVVRAPVRSSSGLDEHWCIMPTVNIPSGFLFHPDDIEVEAKDIMVAGASGDIFAYWAIPEDGQPRPNSLLGALGRFALMRGKLLELTGSKIDYGYYKGPTVPRELRTFGDRIVLASIELRLLER